MHRADERDGRITVREDAQQLTNRTSGLGEVVPQTAMLCEDACQMQARFFQLVKISADKLASPLSLAPFPRKLG
jgi:hypothetical protein